MAIPKIYKYGIELTKPWSAEMYAFNDSIRYDYGKLIIEAINKVDNFDTLNDLACIINPSKYGEGFDLESARSNMLNQFQYVENYWMHEIVPELIEGGWINPIIFKPSPHQPAISIHDLDTNMNIIGFESRKEILELRETYKQTNNNFINN